MNPEVALSNRVPMLSLGRRHFKCHLSGAITHGRLPIRCVYECLHARATRWASSFPPLVPQVETMDPSLFQAGIAAIAIGVTIYLLARYYVHAPVASHAPRLPPGPKPLPLIGNILDMPSPHHPWLHWSKHRALYGPISSVSMFGHHFIIVNDQDCARELLERRSEIYSERPDFPFVSLCVISTCRMLLRSQISSYNVVTSDADGLNARHS